MTAAQSVDEPNARAPVSQRRRFVKLTALLLAGPVIWASHFMAVYLLGEALCVAEVDTPLLGLPVLSTLTLIATAIAVAVTLVTTWWSYRRWQASEIGWDGSTSGAESASANRDQEGQLALAGFLLGVLFVVAIAFVGVPAAVLAC